MFDQHFPIRIGPKVADLHLGINHIGLVVDATIHHCPCKDGWEFVATPHFEGWVPCTDCMRLEHDV